MLSIIAIQQTQLKNRKMITIYMEKILYFLYFFFDTENFV